MQFSETHQTIQFVNLSWSRWINWCVEMWHDQIWDEVATCGQNSEFEDSLQVCKGICEPWTQYPFSEVHMATWNHQSEEISVFTGVFRCHGKSSIYHLRRLNNNLFIFHWSISKGKSIFCSVCEHVQMNQNDLGSQNQKFTVASHIWSGDLVLKGTRNSFK